MNFGTKRLFAGMQLQRLGWEINGHGAVGCGERSQFTTTRLFHDEMPGSCLCHLQNEQCTGSAFMEPYLLALIHIFYAYDLLFLLC